MGQLFLGGAIPGLLLSFMFMVYIGIRTTLQPHLIQKDANPETITLKNRLSGVQDIWPFLLLTITVMGSIYGGIATPTEAAGVGAAMSIVIGICWRVFKWKGLIRSCLNTVKTSAMVFLILINAKVVAVALGYYGIPTFMQNFAQSFQQPILLIAIISIAYLILGTIFDDFSLMLLILPFVLPLVKGLGYDLVWFGVYMCILLQAGLLSPPVGMNLFVIQGVTGAPFKDVVWGSIPFFLILVLGAVIIVLVPDIVLWLPRIVF